MTAATTLALAASVSGVAAAAPVSTGHSGWFWGSPTPQGKDLAAVAFAGDAGYAVGRFGTVLRSGDDGHTWTGLASGSLDDLTAVQVLDPATAIVSGGCTVAETTDAGADFRDLSQLGGRSCGGGVAATAFTDATHGYIALKSGEVLYTDDGGRTLQARASVPGGSLTDIDFTDPLDGVAVAGGGVVRTTDGGRSWTAVPFYGSAESVTFVTPRVAYAVGPSETVARSQDGGATWTTLSWHSLLADDELVDYTHISCVDVSTCVISASNLPGGDEPVLLRTDDGGQSRHALAPSAPGIVDAAFATGTNLVGVGAAGATVVSPDGGTTFPQPVSSSVLGRLSRASETPLRTGGTAGDAYLSGAKGEIAATTDGGQSWSSLRVPGGASVVDTAFPSTAAGYEIGSDATLRTTRNGGLSWRVLDATVHAHSQLAAVDARTVIIAGPRGLQRSRNGGGSFVPVAGSVSLRPYRPAVKIARLALTHIQSSGPRVVAWGSGAAIESTDGGARWRAIRLPRRTSITGLSFVSAQVGWITDGHSEMLATRDGGASWRLVRSLGVPAPGSFAFVDAHDGYLVTPLGADTHALPFDLLATTDGGRSWRPQVVDGAGRAASDPGTIATIAATAGHAYYLSPGGELFQHETALLATTDGGGSPHQSSLTFTTATTHTGGRRSHRYRLSIHGRLRPAPGPSGSQAMVSERRGRNEWSSRLVTVGANGAFQTTLSGIGGPADVVAYALGDGHTDGAGAYRAVTPPARR